MITVSKEFIFDAAHMLAGHEGLCKNIHGHTYRVLVEVSYNNIWTDEVISKGPSAGMVVDFKRLKEVINVALFDKLDHAFIYDSNSESTIETRLVDTMQELGLKTYAMPNRPTAENMTSHFADVIMMALYNIEELKDLTLEKITVYETPTSFAVYYNN